MEAFARGEVSFQKHSDSVAEIQGILVEMRGVKNEIDKLDHEIGIFFPDREKVAARDALRKRVDHLVEVLETKSDNPDYEF